MPSLLYELEEPFSYHMHSKVLIIRGHWDAVEQIPGIILIAIIALIRHMLPMFMQGESDAPASPVAGSLQVI